MKNQEQKIGGNHTSHSTLHTSPKGITLIALIITIIVMLILVGVTLSIVLDENGIIAKTKQAGTRQEIETDKEILQQFALGCLTSEGQIDLSQLNGKRTNGYDITHLGGEYATATKGQTTLYIDKWGNVTEVEPNNNEEQYTFTLNDLNAALGGNLSGYYSNSGGFMNVPSDTFWEVVGTESLRGYYGAKDYDFELTHEDGILSCSNENLVFITSDNLANIKTRDGYAFGFIDTNSSVVDIFVLQWDATNQTIVSSGSSMINLFGNAVFTFNGSSKTSAPISDPAEDLEHVRSWFMDNVENYQALYNRGTVDSDNNLIIDGENTYIKILDLNSNYSVLRVSYNQNLYNIGLDNSFNFTEVHVVESEVEGIFEVEIDENQEDVTIVGTIKVPNTVTGELIIPNTLRSKDGTKDYNVKAIGNSAFSEYNGITIVTMEEGISEIGQWAFSNCENLRTVSLPDSLKKIDSEVFHNCTNLTNIEMPNSLEEQGTLIFNGCSSLQSIDLPSVTPGISKINLNDFAGCTNLEEIIIPTTITIIEEAFYRCDNLRYIKYRGTINEWNEIYGINNVPNTATITYNYSE